MKKRVILVIVCLIIILITARIIYVNASYPYAGINNLKRNETIELQNYNINVSDYKIYNKDDWHQLLNKKNISLEENSNNIIFNKNIKNDSNYDYIVTYDPDGEYRVLLLSLEIENTSDDDQVFNFNDNLSVLISLDKQGIMPNKYYTKFFNEEGNENIIKGNERKIVNFVFLTDGINEFILEARQIGNNQRMYLK